MLMMELYIALFLLSVVTFLSGKNAKVYSLAVSGAFLLIFLFYFSYRYWGLSAVHGTLQTIPISPAYGFNFSLQSSGLSAVLVVIATFVIFAAIFVSSGNYSQVFYGLIMLTMSGLIGLLLSANLLFFYIFWEVVLVPVYFLIGLYGNRRSDTVSLKFFVYTHIGSVLMLLSFFSLYTYYFYETNGSFSMSISSLMNPALFETMPVFWRGFVFFGLFVAFLVKLPSFPLHSWLPDSYETAPYPVTIVLAGALSIMGGYGFFGILLPVVKVIPQGFLLALIVLGIISLIYFSLSAMSQLSMKRMMAYASAAAMGFVTISFGSGAIELQNSFSPSLYNLAFAGGMYQVLVHGLIMAMIFSSLYYVTKSTGKEMIGSLGGIFRGAPVISSFLLVGLLASLGLPGMAGFVAEFSVLAGIYGEIGMWILLIIFAMLITASYHIWMAQRTLFGPYNEVLGNIHDAGASSSAILTVMMLAIIFLGVFPHSVFELFTNYASGVVIP
ncbi:MAG: NADH-quinone oxidoreductase subunit M [Candidatus Thermoplasmatota archaeon]|nr:NADH-quinone oxidoreductase subunit M [Candidatus Thermoplasmatota archaeon]MCL5731747.1 NADH-quinone oxidoreductase subunit M [Candidatus Thermoplasmatota archaeon]